MTSKYAIALYELIQLRANMERSVETFPIERFRDLLGVPPGTYGRADNFQRKVLDPAVLEVNGLSDMGLQIELQRAHSRAPLDAIRIAWWRKSGDEFRTAMEERNRSKVGRMARLRGRVETATPHPSSPLQQKIDSTVQAMRNAGAPESDVQLFLQEYAPEANG